MECHRWAVYGAAASAVGFDAQKGANFNEGKTRYTAEDVRFTTKGDVLYAILLAWPGDGKVTVKSLASGSPHYKGEVGDVRLLGSDAKVRWTRDKDGLNLRLPEHRPCEHAYALKITPRS